MLGNVEAMRRAIDRGAEANRLEVADILDIHRILLRHTADREIAGVVRDQQNWIGGNDHNPLGATYVPPPPERVGELLADLCRFAAREDLPPVVKAAIAHAQFETIHPFADGNGRTGRALVYTLLRQSSEIGSYVPPISLILAAEPKAYIGGLEAYRAGEVSSWCTTFATAAARASRAARQFAESVRAYQESWLERLGHPRSDATTRLLVRALPEQPVLDVPTAQRLTGRSHVAVGKAIDQLEQAGILLRLNQRKWGRLWECGEVLDLAEDFERSVSTL